MPEIAFPVSTAPGVNPGESGGRLINAYAEAAPPGSRSPVARRRCPGLRPRFQAGAATFRGALLVDTQLYIANGDKVYLVTKTAGVYSVSTLSGTLPGTGKVFMARNMNTTPQILIVHSDGMSQIATGAVSDFSDVDLPQPNSISFMDSYFLPTIESGYVAASGNNAVTFAGTDNARAEAQPDGLLRSIPFGSLLMLMGTTSIEFWADTANAAGFPFSRASVARLGLWGRYAVAGYEEGFTDTVMLVCNDNTVRRVAGYDLQRISNPDIEALIAAIEDRDTLEASVYIANGRTVFVLSSDDWTWEWCAGQWNERKSLGQERWRATGGIRAFDEWLTFDRATNDVYLIDPTYPRENTDQLVYEVRSTQAHRFPARAEIKRAVFDMMTGVGMDAGVYPIETDPQVQISWSIDGGITFGNPIFRALGKQGGRRQIGVRNCGVTKALGIQFRLVVADPVDVALYGGADDVEPRLAA